MIQMKYKDLLHPQLQMILGKIANTQMAPAKSYEVNKLLAAIREEIKKTREESAQTLRTFVKFDGDKPALKKDEKGEHIYNAQGHPEVEFIDQFSVDHPDYLSAFEQFEKKFTSIEFRPWSIDMLTDCKLSPAEIDVLGPLLTNKPYLQAVEEKYN